MWRVIDYLYDGWIVMNMTTRQSHGHDGGLLLCYGSDIIVSWWWFLIDLAYSLFFVTVTISAYAFFSSAPPWVERLLDLEDWCIPLTLRDSVDALRFRFFCRATYPFNWFWILTPSLDCSNGVDAAVLMEPHEARWRCCRLHCLRWWLKAVRYLSIDKK